jgi:hypothetical protein
MRHSDMMAMALLYCLYNIAKLVPNHQERVHLSLSRSLHSQCRPTGVWTAIWS